MRYLFILLVTLLIHAPAAVADDDTKKLEYTRLLDSKINLREPADRRGQTLLWLLDKSGKEVVELNYIGAMQFSEGLSSVTSSSCRNGYIDVSGQIVIPIQFANSRAFSEGLAWVWTESRENGYIDRNGRQVITGKDLFEGGEFSEGLAVVRVRKSTSEVNDGRIGGDDLPGNWGYIGKDGKLAFTPKFKAAKAFHEGRAAVSITKKKWFFIDKTGTQIGDQFDDVGSFSESLAPVCHDGKWGFVDLNGKVVISPAFKYARNFASGLAAVNAGEKFGFIDKSGAFAIAPQYVDARSFSQDLCAVRAESGTWGFIDRTGKFVIKPSFDNVEAFSCGLALVYKEKERKYGFIDRMGKLIVKPRYDFAESFSDDRAIVSCKNWNHPIMRLALMSAHLSGLKIHRDLSSPTGVYVPLDLTDALKELDEMLPSAAKNDISIIEKSEMINYHHGFGTWLRNNWGLWKGLRLAIYLRSIGIVHPDDMSGKILDSYWAKVHGISE